MLLIIFTKNPVLGKVKTRVAATIGEEAALKVYQQLMRHTCNISKAVDAKRWVYYSDELPEEDIFEAHFFEKKLQSGDDLGQRMQAAFEAGFEAGFQRIVIIGSDCFELTTTIVQEAFKLLERTDVVIGPAFDGGYYLLGMNRLYPSLFQNKAWSTESVLHDSISDLNNLHLVYDMLPPLSDVDEADDIPETLKLISGI